MAPVLCLVSDRQRWGRSWQDAVAHQAGVAARAGVHLIQLREPGLDGGELRELVARCLDATHGTRARIVVNDRLDVALAAAAHGVHLRGDSMPADRVRQRCPRPFLIGRSIHSASEAAQADPEIVDYLIFGTVFPTSSKPDREPAGLEGLAAAATATILPVLAIGGITMASVPAVLAAGASGVAGISVFVDTSGSPWL